jgi:hypothetical protein
MCILSKNCFLFSLIMSLICTFIFNIGCTSKNCELTADPSNYGGCAFILALDGSGLTADDIPVIHTPNCGYAAFPEPVLNSCTEPLAPGVSDLRGLWETVTGPACGHVERIEQCGNRVVITGGGVIHDMRADGTVANGVNDISVIMCAPIRVAASFTNGKLELRPNGGAVAVTRWIEDDELVLVYLGKTFRMKQICN